MITIFDINKQISKKINVDIETIEHVNNIYYKELINNLNNYTSSQIKLSGLCTFKARFGSVKQRIWTLIKYIRKLEQKKQTDHVVYEINLKKQELKKIWKIKNEFAEKTYNRIKKKK